MTFTWDVLIPAYNAERYIENAIRSVECQRFSPSNIIVCDDASSDKTQDKILDFATVQVCENSYNQGVGITRQILLRESSSPWIIYLDADDELMPHASEVFAKAIADNPGAKVIAFEAAEKYCIDSGISVHTDTVITPVNISHRDLLKRNPICSSATLLNRDAVIEAGGFTEARRLIDYCLWFRVARKFPGGLVHHNVPVVTRLISSDTITGNVNPAVLEEARLLTREWAYSYGQGILASRLRYQIRLVVLWLRGLSRNADYGKASHEYLRPRELEGLWPMFNILNVLRSKLGADIYSKLRSARATLTLDVLKQRRNGRRQ